MGIERTGALKQALKPETPKWRKCVKENAGGSTKLTMNCRTDTVIIHDGQEAGPYRRRPDGGPWPSLTHPNYIVQADTIRELACKKR